MFNRCLLFFLCLLVISPHSTEGIESSPFDKEQRLDRVVPLSVKDGPLRVVLNEVGKATNLRLTCDAGTADLRVTLLLKTLPARRVLETLMNLLRLSVQKEGGDGYRFYRSIPPFLSLSDPAVAAEVKRQEQLREEDKQYRQQLTKFMDELLTQHKLSDDQVLTLLRQYPLVARKLEEKPWHVASFRVMTWLSPADWEKASVGGVSFNYQQWVAMGGDTNALFNIPPQYVERIGNVRRDPGTSGIQQIYIHWQPNGTLILGQTYHLEKGSFIDAFLVYR
jgi:hypothetical protein